MAQHFLLSAQARRVRHVEVPFAHHAFRELTGVQLAVGLQVADTDIGDLALLEEAMTNDVLGPLRLASFEQTYRGVDVS